MAKILTDATIIKNVNALGKKADIPYICTNPLKGRMKSRARIIEIQCIKTKKKKTVILNNLRSNSNPFGEIHNKLSEDSIKELINHCGQKTNGAKFIFSKTFIIEINNKKRRMVEVQNIETKEKKSAAYHKIKNGCNPFAVNGDQTRHSIEYVKNLVNKVGMKTNGPKFIFIETFIIKKYGKSNRLVKVQSIETKEIKTTDFSALRKGCNPFKTFSSKEVIRLVNEYGQKTAGPKFICINPVVRFDMNGFRIVKVKCLKTKKTKNARFTGLRVGQNPFNEIQNRVEVNQVQPMYERLFNKLNIEFKKSYTLGKNSIIDFKIKLPNKNKFDLVEVKRSDKFIKSGRDQFSRYKKLSTLKQHNVDKFYLSDPKGSHKKHGFISIRELEKKLLQELR